MSVGRADAGLPRKRVPVRNVAVAAGVLVAAMLATSLVAATPSRALGGLTIGFSSDAALVADNAATRAEWQGRAVAEGAGMVRVDIKWSQVAPRRRPAGFRPADPASRGYNWALSDSVIRGIAAHRMRVLLMIYLAPKWAEGPHRPSNVGPGSWDPNAEQFASFAQAAARRYSGKYPDPQHPGKFLPRVAYWQAWNEPNLGYYLSPQWRSTGHGYAPASPGVYRTMLNAFYAAVKGVNRSNFVVMGGTAPYGDPPGYARMYPLMFYRYLFCLSDTLAPLACPQPVHLDAVDTHPYEISAPTVHATGPDNVSVPDVWKVGQVVRAGVSAGHVLPRAHKRVWVTEIAWDTDPPSTNSIAHSLATQARWVELAMYVLWREGVDTVLWLEIRDLRSRRYFHQAFDWSGMYFYHGAPKPSATSVRFPFVTERQSANGVQAWGRAPRGGLLTVSRSLGRGRWTVVARRRVGPRQVFLITIALTGPAVLRAQVAGATSLPWTQSG